MFEKVVAVNSQAHLATRIREIRSFAFSAGTHLAYLALAEFTRAASVFPIVFIEDSAIDEFRPVALLGLRPNENLFVDSTGSWSAAYIPAVIRRYPFALLPSDQEGQFVVCIDEGSELVSATEGAPMFDPSGAPTALLDNAKRYLAELHQMEQVTTLFCQWCKEHNMFTPLNMRIQDGAAVKDLTGCYVINEERLNKLPDEMFLQLRARGYIPGLYAHLLSLGQTERLARLLREREAR
jgi:SapC